MTYIQVLENAVDDLTISSQAKGEIMNQLRLLCLSLLLLVGCESSETKEKAEVSGQSNLTKNETSEPMAIIPSNPAESTALNDSKPETSSQPTIDELNARTVLSDAVAAAKADNKALFVHFSADW
ncbi:MAG: hypothetical protein P8J27_15090 [Mariniblastus sp.]|nr:hypothetical protein [Mariniblastus sp.]